MTKAQATLLAAAKDAARHLMQRFERPQSVGMHDGLGQARMLTAAIADVEAEAKENELMPMKCSWCGTMLRAGSPLLPISHGICRQCYDTLKAEEHADPARAIR